MIRMDRCSGVLLSFGSAAVGQEWVVINDTLRCLNVVVDIDECTTNTHNCDPDASCINTDGSFNCTCNQGFSGNGTTCSGENH